MSLIAHFHHSGRKRVSSLLAPLVIAVAVLALLPTAAQAAAATIAPQPGAQGQFESDGRGGRPPYGRFHWRHNRRGGPRHQFRQQPHGHFNGPRCCDRQGSPPGQHQNHGYSDGKGLPHGHGDHPHRQGHDYDRDHKQYGYDDDDEKYAHDKYEDEAAEDQGYESGEEPYNDDTEEKGGVSSAEEATEGAAASEDATGEEKGGVAPSDTVTETASVTDTAAITDATDVSGTVANGDAIVYLNSNDELGEFLADANGMTLYRFDRDSADASFCTGDCAVNWPPLLVDVDAQLVAGEGISGELSAIVRDDGTVQVTYNGSPLYNFVDDQQPGDVSGQGVGDAWNVATP